MAWIGRKWHLFTDLNEPIHLLVPGLNYPLDDVPIEDCGNALNPTHEPGDGSGGRDALNPSDESHLLLMMAMEVSYMYALLFVSYRNLLSSFFYATFKLTQ